MGANYSCHKEPSAHIGWFRFPGELYLVVFLSGEP